MSSKRISTADPFDVDFADIPLTSADLEALARARVLRPLSAEEYQRWADLAGPLDGRRSWRDNSDADEPFSLD